MSASEYEVGSPEAPLAVEPGVPTAPTEPPGPGGPTPARPFRMIPYFIGTFIDTLGSGFWMPFGLIFFVQAQGLPLGQVGLGLTVGGIAALALGPIGGMLSDRFGPVPVVFASNLLRVVTFCFYPFVNSLWQLIPLAALTAAGDRLYWTANTPLMSRLREGRALDRILGSQAVVRIIGLGVGAGTAALLAGLPDGLHLLAYVNAGTYAVAGLMVLVAAGGLSIERTAPHEDGGESAARRWRTIVSDRPFLLLCTVHAVLVLGSSSLVVILPLVAVDTLDGPVWLASVSIVLGNVVLAIAQKPVITASEHVPRLRGITLGALVMALSFLLLVPAGWVSRGAAITLVLVTSAIGVLGECAAFPLMTAAANQAAPEALRGRYSAVFQTFWGAANVIAPALFTGLLAISNAVLWLVLGVATLLTIPVLRSVSTRLPSACLRE